MNSIISIGCITMVVSATLGLLYLLAYFSQVLESEEEAEVSSKRRSS